MGKQLRHPTWLEALRLVQELKADMLIMDPMLTELELGKGFALLTKVIESHDAPDLRYWDVPFPEAHAEIVCICPENARDTVKQVIYGIWGNELVKI